MEAFLKYHTYPSQHCRTLLTCLVLYSITSRTTHHSLDVVREAGQAVHQDLAGAGLGPGQVVLVQPRPPGLAVDQEPLAGVQLDTVGKTIIILVYRGFITILVMVHLMSLTRTSVSFVSILYLMSLPEGAEDTSHRASCNGKFVLDTVR